MGSRPAHVRKNDSCLTDRSRFVIFPVWRCRSRVVRWSTSRRMHFSSCSSLARSSLVRSSTREHSSCGDGRGTVRTGRQTSRGAGDGSKALRSSSSARSMWARKRSLVRSSTREHTVAAEVGVAERSMWWPKPWASDSSRRLCGDLGVLQRAAHLEVEAAADQHERDVVQRVRVALAQLVGPDDQRVVEQAAARRPARASRPAASPGRPAARSTSLLIFVSFSCAVFVAVRLVRQLVVPLVDAEPAHPRLPTELVILQRGDAGEVGREAVDHQVDLHLADLGHVVVLFLHARLQFRHRVADVSCRSPAP
jgi:hypothetical protein